ncbi:inositol hexakisphosphate and diphosphoinositol-pentakisphosphate kinase [Coemansia spiralis]|uniref:Inositol hexakisphosphate and diphosphoinositol-pentakisphosphate kinase n=2 Tax=Coemansia TaxID=4863 RepID=A0A9W8G0C5_9FUNG|nr:inositol hexakisphosphate and diphosphoinositol-pentakisphosphate kinase [Coemansia umbellata]KAJ2674150.1 inositol hexakisphosphate and diphosphoinositol-pentakisphosphate kinase [Coemansia spiralis]
MAQQATTHFIDLPQPEGRKPLLGICAMDSKARSKPMTNILNRLARRYTLVFFGEKTILDEEIEAWPVCDFLISFFSRGFPLEKALLYSQLRRPFLVNSLVRQFLLLDRRLVLAMLKHINVPTPFHLVASSHPPTIHPLLRRVLEQQGVALDLVPAALEIVDEDTIRVGARTLSKPFVEKPCDAEDHNIHIYYASWQGGGMRRLFRKIGNKSSEFVAGPSTLRQGSFVYEEFVDTRAVDVKVYTVGRSYAHAETRKSPVADGHVRRNSDGKEMRFVTQLTAQERLFAQRVSDAFGQRVCGFDILRSDRGPLVMDVNGWSFVKGNEDYYDMAARILDERFQEAVHTRWVARFVDPHGSHGSRWVLKGVFDVCRHADRTPKQKVKCELECADVLELLAGGEAEVVLRTREELEAALAALERSRSSPVHLVDALRRKIAMPGTKVQLKPRDGRVQLVLKWGGECTHAGLVQSQDLGENMRKDLCLLNRSLLDDVRIYSSTERRVLSTVAEFSSSLLGAPKPHVADLVTVSSKLLDDSSDAKPEMDMAKSQLRQLFNFHGPLAENPLGHLASANPFGTTPREFLDEMCAIMCRLIERMETNFAQLSGDQLGCLQREWCCNETAELFRERWKKILGDFRHVGHGELVYDPAKVGELYDSLKYDALHNRRFLERIFMTPEDLHRELDAIAAEDALPTIGAFAESPSHASDCMKTPDAFGHGEPRLSAVDTALPSLDIAEMSTATLPSLNIAETSTTTLPSITVPAIDAQSVESSLNHTSPPHSPAYPPDPLFTQQEVRELYYKAKILFDFVTWREYGVDPGQQRKIGTQVSGPLLQQLISDLEATQSGQQPRTRFYFTKESHIYTLLNLVLLSDIPLAQTDPVGELDYLTHIIFEVYERKPDDINVDTEYSLRIGLSPGANCLHILDINMDPMHALKVLPRRNFSTHIPLTKAIQMLQSCGGGHLFS